MSFRHVTVRTPADEACPFLHSPEPARVERLGWLLFPSHFVLALWLLKPYFAPASVAEQQTFGAADHASPLGWVVAAAFTALVAVRPFAVCTRLAGRRAEGWLAFSMVGWGYLNLLGCAALRAAGEGASASEILGTVGMAAIFGLFAALACTSVFIVLGALTLRAALALDLSRTFDSRDELTQLVSVHASAVLAIIALCDGGFARALLASRIGQLSSGALALSALWRFVRASHRIWTRRAFVRRVRRGEVVGYGVSAVGVDASTPLLSRQVAEHAGDDAPEALSREVPAGVDGAYRSGSLSLPLVRLR